MKKLLAVASVILLVALFVGTAGFLYRKSSKPETVWQTASPTRSDIVRKAVATGSVVPRKEVAIKPLVSGILDEIHVEPGEVVKQGDLIARIRIVPDSVSLNNAETRLNRARLALANAERELQRNAALRADGTIAEATFQQAELAAANAREELQAASDNLEIIRRGTTQRSGQTSNTLVRATIAGTVLEVPVEVGGSVIEANTFNEGTTIATVADMNDMIFEGRVDESEVGKLRTGMTLLLTIGAVEAERLEATLEHIAPKGVEKDGAIQFEIRAALEPRQDVTIRANYSANADIVLDRRENVLSLPESLVAFEGDKAFVEVETAPQTFERREVRTGISDGIQVEIVDGLAEDARVKAGEAAPGGEEAAAQAGGARTRRG